MKPTLLERFDISSENPESEQTRIHFIRHHLDDRNEMVSTLTGNTHGTLYIDQYYQQSPNQRCEKKMQFSDSLSVSLASALDVGDSKK